MAQYRVENKTNQVIWWKDKGWLSGDLPPGEVRAVESDHDADVTIFAKIQNRDWDWGRVWILLGRTLEVQGKQSWCLKE
jgi:hypothetical protein